MPTSEKEIILQEIEQIPPHLFKDLLDFIELLKAKEKLKREERKRDYLGRIQSISTWNEEDIQRIENAGKEFENWKIA